MVVNPYRSESESHSHASPCHHPHFNTRSLILGCLILFSVCSYIFHVNHDFKIHNTPKLRGEINRKPILVIDTEDTGEKSGIINKISPLIRTKDEPPAVEPTFKPVQDMIDVPSVDVVEHTNENVETSHDLSELSSKIYIPAVKEEMKDELNTVEHTEPLVDPLVEEPSPEFSQPVVDHTRSSRIVSPKTEHATTSPDVEKSVIETDKLTNGAENASVDNISKLVLEADIPSRSNNGTLDELKEPQSALEGGDTDPVSFRPAFVINMEDKRSDAIVSGIVEKALQAEAAAAELKLAHKEKGATLRADLAEPISAMSPPMHEPPVTALSPPDHPLLGSESTKTPVVLAVHKSNIPQEPELPLHTRTDGKDGTESLKSLLDPIHHDDMHTKANIVKEAPPVVVPAAPPLKGVITADVLTSSVHDTEPVDGLVALHNEERKIPHTADTPTSSVDTIPDTPSLSEVVGEKVAAQMERDMTPIEVPSTPVAATVEEKDLKEHPLIESNSKMDHSVGSQEPVESETTHKKVVVKVAPPVEVAEEVPFDILNAVPVSTTANNRPSSFDLKQTFVKHPKLAAVSKPDEHPVDAKVDFCAGHVDPFEGQPVETFDPPKAAPFDKVTEWKEEVKAMIKKIGKEKLFEIMSYKNPMVKFFGTQKSGRVSPSKVPFREPERPSTGVLNETKRKQLETILEKEKRKEKRERISSVLLQRLVDKFGSKQRAIINFFVEEFLNSHDQINSTDVSDLEREISNAVNMKYNEANGGNAVSQTEQRTEKQEQKHVTINSARERPGTGSEWQAIQAYQIIQGEEHDRKEREKQWQKKKTFKKSLDEHITVKTKLNSVTPVGVLDDKQYAQYIHKDIQVYHQQEAEKYAAMRKRCSDEAALRREQIADQQRRVDEEKENFRLAEERNLQRAKDLQAREAEILANKRQKEQDRRRVIELENAANDRRKAQQKAEDAENDQRLMAEYARKLDSEAQAREQAFQRRMQDMEKNAFKFENDGAGKVAREERLKEEQLLLKEQARKEALDSAKERKKEEDRLQRVKIQLMENSRQLKRHEQQSVEEVERDHLLAIQFQKDVTAFRRSEEEKLRQLKEKQASYSQILHKQMDAKQMTSRKDMFITPAEKGINMPTLREITEDPHMLSRVMHRVRIATATPSTKK